MKSKEALTKLLSEIKVFEKPDEDLWKNAVRQTFQEFLKIKIDIDAKAINSTILEQFVKEHKEEINNNEFEKLFVVWLNLHGDDSELAGSLAGLLIKAKVNFLDYMKRIPENMFASIKGIDSIEFPENIRFINSDAFYDSSIHNIKIKQGTKIENNYFNGYFYDNFIKYVNIEYYD